MHPQNCLTLASTKLTLMSPPSFHPHFRCLQVWTLTRAPPSPCQVNEPFLDLMASLVAAHNGANPDPGTNLGTGSA